MRHDNQYKWWICLLLYNNAIGCVRLVFIGLLLAGAASATACQAQEKQPPSSSSRTSRAE